MAKIMAEEHYRVVVFPRTGKGTIGEQIALRLFPNFIIPREALYLLPMIIIKFIIIKYIIREIIIIFVLYKNEAV